MFQARQARALRTHLTVAACWDSGDHLHSGAKTLQAGSASIVTLPWMGSTGPILRVITTSPVWTEHGAHFYVVGQCRPDTRDAEASKRDCQGYPAARREVRRRVAQLLSGSSVAARVD